MNKSSFQILPYDIKAAIFEYVPLLEYSNLAVVCKDFQYILQKNPDLWARHLFNTFLNFLPKTSPFHDEDFFEQIISLDESKIKFTQMTSSRDLLFEHYNIMKKWKSFFSPLLSPEDHKLFIKELFETVARPLPPPPCLKKDTQYFPTNTLFQNFLTEVHFGVHGRPLFQEKKQNVIENIAKKMKNNLLSKKMNKDRLIATRWYLFNKGRKDSKKSSGADKASSLKFKSKIIQKPGKRERRTNQITRKQSCTFQEKSEKEESCVEEFYRILNELITNYCKMIFTYLRAIQDPYLLLSEYNRLWSRFALLIIDFSQAFSPLAKLFNTLYEDVCRGLPHFPEFSTWRLMVKIWISEIFSNLSYFLGEAFRSILMKIRSQTKSLLAKKLESSCSSCIQAQRNSDGSNAPFDQFFYKVKRSEKERSDIPIKDLTKLLKGFYHAIEDISYNEFTIFYWDCSSGDKKTPKGILDSLVLEDTKTFYEYCKGCFWQDSNHFEKFLRDDNNFLEKIFGKQFSPELRQAQTSIIRDFLSRIFNQALKKVESPVQLRRKLSDELLTSNINLAQLFKFISIDDEIQKKLFEKKQDKELIVSTLQKNGKVLNSYISYLVREEEEMESQIMEFEETKCMRVMRGFIVADEKYKRFFELGQNLSIGEIQKVGMEGKDIQEEVELTEDDIVFL